MRSMLSQRGFSLAELAVGVGISTIIALGTGQVIVKAFRDSQQMASRFEGFSLGKEVGAWMASPRLKQDPAICGDRLQLVGFNAAAFAGDAASSEGSEIRFNLHGGLTLSEGAVIQGVKPVTVKKFRFSDAEIYFSDVENNRTYFNGRMYLALEGNRGDGQKQAYAPQIIGGVTLAINNATGAVESCSQTPSLSNSSFCNSINSFGVDDASNCSVTIEEIGAASCGPTEKFVGFIHEPELQVACPPADKIDCSSRYSGVRGVRHSIPSENPAKLLSQPECTKLAQDTAAEAPAIPPLAPTGANSPLQPAPAPVPAVGPGDPGQVDCANPNAMLDYANCIEIQNALAVSGTEGRTVICPPPPKCYSVAQGPAPVNPVAPAPPPADIPPALTTCVCGTGTVANGEFCGSYYQGSFGFFYTPIIASSVYVCRDGELVLQSDTNPLNPLIEPARVEPPPSNIRDGTFRRLNPIGGNRYVEP